MKWIGDVGVDVIKSDIAYVKEKEKQAQIVGSLARRTSDDIILTFLKEIKVRTGNLSNKLTGCSILDNGEIMMVLKCVSFVCVNINDIYTCTSRNSCRFCFEKIDCFTRLTQTP
jgi:hypothetical protein